MTGRRGVLLLHQITRRECLSKKRVIIFAGALVCIGAACFIFEPFAPRYEGKTVSQWLDRLEREQSAFATLIKANSGIVNVNLTAPPGEVIEGFGQAAVPALQKAARGTEFISQLRRILPNSITRRSVQFQLLEMRKSHFEEIAQDWLRELERLKISFRSGNPPAVRQLDEMPWILRLVPRKKAGEKDSARTLYQPALRQLPSRRSRGEPTRVSIS